MKKSATVLMFCFLAWGIVICTSVVQAEGEMPQILYVSDSDSPYPRWVAAEAAFDSNGEAVSSLCHLAACTFLGDIAATPPDPASGCIRVEEFYTCLVDPPDRSTLANSVKNSQLVFLAKIVDAAFGFKDGEPGQLFRVESVRDFKGVRILDSYFFFFPVGDFVAGEYNICKIDRSYPVAPVVGDEVLLMVPRLEDQAEPFLDIWEAEGVIVARKSLGDERISEIRFPRSFQSLRETIRGREELIEAVENALEGGQ